MNIGETKAQHFRHVCPRNCPSSCGMISTVENGVLVKVEGDPKHGYTRGRLCAKGYAYPELVYSPSRLRYPLRQVPRGSGNWERISWDEALTVIADKMLELRERYGSFLPVCLNRQSGDLGILHLATEGMFRSLGAVTLVNGTSCWSAGLDARVYDFGANCNSDPEIMSEAQFIILWGTNPAWTAIHQMAYLEAARSHGARVVTIDPIYTATARWSDAYIQVRPGGDGALALGMARALWEHDAVDHDFLVSCVRGWPEFKDYLEQQVNWEWVEAKSGVKAEIVVDLALAYAASRPAAIWIGLGLQRHKNGGQNVRAIDALAALTGNIGVRGGGTYFPDQQAWLFNMHIMSYQPPSSSFGSLKPRLININDFAAELDRLEKQASLANGGPPVKMIWFSCRNALAQDGNVGALAQALSKIDLVVTVDQFLTATARWSDIVLPATTCFEHWDVVASWWHRWIGVSQPAIVPVGESRSDLAIAWSLSAKINQLSPGCCSFPTEGDEKEWLEDELEGKMFSLLGVGQLQELLEGPRKLNLAAVAWEDRTFATPDGKYHLWSELAAADGFPPLPVYVDSAEAGHASLYPFRLLTPHSQLSINSQFWDLPSLNALELQGRLWIHPETAKLRNLKTGDRARVYNSQGEIMLVAEVTEAVPPGVLVCYQGWGGWMANGGNEPRPGAVAGLSNRPGLGLNQVVSSAATDMGRRSTGQPGLALHDSWVNLSRCW